MHPVNACSSCKRTLPASPFHTRMQAFNQVFVIKHTRPIATSDFAPTSCLCPFPLIHNGEATGLSDRRKWRTATGGRPRRKTTARRPTEKQILEDAARCAQPLEAGVLVERPEVPSSCSRALRLRYRPNRRKPGRSGPLKYLGTLLLKYLPTKPGIGPFESMITKGRPARGQE